MTIREAIRELDLWGAGAVFTLTEYEDSNKTNMMLIKDWKDLVSQVRRGGICGKGGGGGRTGAVCTVME